MYRDSNLSSSADGLPVAPSRALIDDYNARLSSANSTIGSLRSQLTAVQAVRSECSKKFISGPCYNANSDQQDDIIRQIQSQESIVSDLQGKITVAETNFKRANEEYQAAIKALGSSNPDVIKAQMESDLKKSSLENNKSLIIYGIIGVVVLAAIAGVVIWVIRKKG